jgi:hypothetical protein
MSKEDIRTSMNGWQLLCHPLSPRASVALPDGFPSDLDIKVGAMRREATFNNDATCTTFNRKVMPPTMAIDQE